MKYIAGGQIALSNDFRFHHVMWIELVISP